MMPIPYIETDCVIEHNNKKFESGGAFITDMHIIAYLGNNGKLLDWHGSVIGTYRILSTWRTPRSFVSDTMSSIEAFVNRVRYLGRGAGEGMIFRGKRSPIQPKGK